MTAEELDALWEKAAPADAKAYSKEEDLEALWEQATPAESVSPTTSTVTEHTPMIVGPGGIILRESKTETKEVEDTIRPTETSLVDTISDTIQNVSKAMQANPGWTGQAMRSVMLPSLNKAMTDTHAQKLGYKNAEDYNEQQEIVYKRELLRGVGKAEEITGAVLSGVLDPVTLATGAYGLTAKGVSRLLKIGAAGSGYAGTYEALNQLAEDGEITSPGAIAAWTVLGGGTALGLDKAFRIGSKILDERTMKALESAIQKNIDEGLNPQAAYDDALNKMGITDTNILSMVDSTGRKLELRAGRTKGQFGEELLPPEKRNPILDSPELKSQSTLQKAMQVAAKPFTYVGEKFNKYAEPISSRIAKINPGLANRVRKLEHNIHMDTNRWRDSVVPFINHVAQLDDKVQVDLHKALINENFTRAREIISTLPNKNEALRAFDSARATLKEIREEYIKAGVDVAEVQNYWPRPLKGGEYRNLREKLTPEQSSYLDRVLADAEQRKGSKLSFKEQSDVVNSALKGVTPQGLKGPAAAKQRLLPSVTDELYPHYAGMEDGIMSYIDHAAMSINERKFFGHNVSSAELNFNPTSTIGSFVADLMRRGEIRGRDKSTLEDLLHARFGYKDTSGGWQNVKNFFYATKLAQADSALTQLADLGISAYMNGLGRTIMTVLRPTNITAEDIGARKISQEFGTTNATAKTLDKLFKASGFNRIDKLGKEVYINASLAKNRDMVKTARGTDKFIRKWGQWYGAETEQLVKDLQAGKMTDNVRLLLWNELSDVQPISLSEMPEAYLNMNGGRLLYALKSFTIKQFDLLRREAFSKISSRNPRDQAEGVRNLMHFGMLFTGANVSVEQLKNFIVGRPMDDLPDAVVRNIWKNFGLSQYIVDKMKFEENKDGLTKWKGLTSMADWVLGPYTGLAETGEAIVSDAANFGTGMLDIYNSEALKEIPVVGRVFYNMFGAGAAKYEDKKMREFMGRGNADE